MNHLPEIGAAIALTQALIAFAVLWSSHRQRLVDRGMQRVIRIHDWGNDCIDALAEAGQFSLSNTSDFSDEYCYTMYKGDILHRLSSLIDRGRLFYRNTDQDKFGHSKFPARRGYRPEILDPLVAAYRSILVLSGSADKGSFERLCRWRGRFITLLQYEIDSSWLKKARYYSDSPGTEAGISVTAESEPPEWPEDRLPVQGKELVPARKRRLERLCRARRVRLAG